MLKLPSQTLMTSALKFRRDLLVLCFFLAYLSDSEGMDRRSTAYLSSSHSSDHVNLLPSATRLLPRRRMDVGGVSRRVERRRGSFDVVNSEGMIRGFQQVGGLAAVTADVFNAFLVLINTLLSRNLLGSLWQVFREVPVVAFMLFFLIETYNSIIVFVFLFFLILTTFWPFLSTFITKRCAYVRFSVVLFVIPSLLL